MENEFEYFTGRASMHISSKQYIYDLEQPRYFGAPIYPSHAPGYVYTLHRHHERGMSEAKMTSIERRASTLHCQ